MSNQTEQTLYKDYETTEFWTVVIEWDGQKPPTKWYRRMHELVGGVGGDKSESPLERRSVHDRAVIFQEGAILCKSEWMARTLARYAYWEIGDMLLEEEEGARPTVLVGKAEMTNDLSMTDADRDVFRRIGEVLGKPGKKPAEQDYTIACSECMTVQKDVQPKGRVLTCPNCRGLKIQYRRGHHSLNWRRGDAELIEAWAGSRFAVHHWEPAEMFTNEEAPEEAPEPAVGIEPADEKEARILETMRASDEIVNVAKAIEADDGIEDAIAFLDAIFAGRAYYNRDQREDARIEAATRYYQTVNKTPELKPSPIVMAESPMPDILDAALKLHADKVVGYMIEYL